MIESDRTSDRTYQHFFILQRFSVFCFLWHVQVPEVRCMRNYLRPNEPNFTGDYSDPSQYPDAVFCAKESKTWSVSFSSQLRGGLTKYTSADQTHADKIDDCNTLQREFEDSFCSYRSDLIRVCVVNWTVALHMLRHCIQPAVL